MEIPLTEPALPDFGALEREAEELFSPLPARLQGGRHGSLSTIQRGMISGLWRWPGPLILVGLWHHFAGCHWCALSQGKALTEKPLITVPSTPCNHCAFVQTNVHHKELPAQKAGLQRPKQCIQIQYTQCKWRNKHPNFLTCSHSIPFVTWWHHIGLLYFLLIQKPNGICWKSLFFWT